MIPDNENIIDVTDERFKDVPISLDGEVLLERTMDNNGNVSGYLTIPVDKIIEIMQNQARQEIEITNIKKDVDECSGSMKKLKETSNNRIWEVCKLGIAGIVGGLIGKFF